MALREIGLVTLFQPAARVRHHRGASTTHHFKPFVSARNRGIFMEKWGNKLSVHEPPDRKSIKGVERAIARAERAAETVRTIEYRRLPERRKPADLDLEEQERRQLERGRIVQKEYVKHLEAKLDAMFVVAKVQGSRRLLRAWQRISAWINRLSGGSFDSKL